MKRIILWSISAISLLLFANFGMQDSTTAGREKPKVNFHGTLVDSTGKKYKVANITISGLYKQIPFYQPPPEKADDPTLNTTRIDLTEVYQLSVPNPNKVSTFDERQYIDVEITSNNTEKTKHNYIVEKTRKLYCDQVDGKLSYEKDFAMETVKLITIDGHKLREGEKPAPEETAGKPSTDSKKTATDAIVQKLEKEVKDIPKGDGKLAQVKDKLVAIVDDLKKTASGLFN